MDPTRRRARATGIVSIAASSLLSVTPVPAHAQSSEADRRFEHARALHKAGKIEESCAAFEESARIEPRVSTLLAIGLCKEELGKLASALAAFQDALARVKDPVNKDIATKRAAALELRVSRLTISVAPEARVAGLTVSRNGQPLEAADYGRAIPVDGGSYEIAASAPGYRRWSTSVQIAPEGDKIPLDVPRLVEESPRVEPGPGAPAARGAAESATAPARAVTPPLGRVSVGLAFGGTTHREDTDGVTSTRDLSGGLRLVAGYPMPRGALRATLQVLYTRESFEDVYHHVDLFGTTLGLDYLWAWRSGLASAAGLGISLDVEDNNYNSSPPSVGGALRASPLVVRLATPNLELGLHLMYVSSSRVLVGLFGIDWFVW